VGGSTGPGIFAWVSGVVEVKITVVDKDHVIITMGWWLWKRQAHLHKESIDWYFTNSGKKVDNLLWLYIHKTVNPEPPVPEDWEPVRRKAKLPVAKLLTSGDK
jgi:hypothetical protein